MPDIAPLLLALIVIHGLARLVSWIAVRVGQPSVLGELIAGIVIGNLGLLGFHRLEWMQSNTILAVLAELGVIVLLFQVGLESTVEGMLRVGGSAFLVATIGVAVPFALGWLAGLWLLPGASPYVPVFLGAVLTATSVGITARVLSDLKETDSLEGRIVLGAAVVDDVLGLMILAVVTAMVGAANGEGRALSPAEIAGIAGKAIGFLAGAIVLGSVLGPRLFGLAARVRVRGILETAGLGFCFLFSYLAVLAGLAPIVGAFAAGLVLVPASFEPFEENRERPFEERLLPIGNFLIPIFFVMTGIRVDLRTLADPRILALAAVLTLAAWLGKQASSIGVLEGGVDRITVGLAMVPRGEVGLIFASIGTTLVIGGEAVIGPAAYSAVVIMVIVTTLVTPPALQWSFGRRRAARAPARRAG